MDGNIQGLIERMAGVREILEIGLPMPFVMTYGTFEVRRATR